MNYTEILEALREFTAREKIELLAPALEAGLISPYPPIQKYALDLARTSKPEAAAEELFTALCKDVLGRPPTPQVVAGEGWVDFMLPEPKGEPQPLELKPLFQRGAPDTLWRSDANPAHHAVQIKRYLREHEFLILTDLRTAWLCNARDYPFENKPFAELPFADFFARCRETRSILDTLRRLEDTAEKPELEQQFFDDLKIWYAAFERVRWTPPERTPESIILLLNKLIFALTIEGFGLVQHRFVQEAYARYTQLWGPKGPHRVTRKFLEFFEDFFDEYYDTEIFSERLWGHLDPDPANLKRFCEKLDFVLGVNTWDQAFSRGLVHYNYRRIDEDIFGKSYEMFLAANRKDEGIYYTPASITKPMADSMVNSLAGPLVGDICAAVGSQQCDFARAENLMAELAEIRVADTACGSGGFLIKVLRAFWDQYRRIDQACAWVQKLFRPENGELGLAEMPPNVNAALGFRRRQSFDDRRVLIAQILLRHVFGVDKDAGALEVAKTNVWKEAVKLSAADYNYRLLNTEVVRILPNLQLNFHCADSLVDVDLAREAAWLAEYHQAELKKLSDLRAHYVSNPMQHGPLKEALSLREKVRADLVEHFQNEDLPCEPAGFALHFWPCWFTSEGKTRENPGFHGVIGNPPWEAVKPMRKEFARQHKYERDAQDFERWFQRKLEEDADFRSRWEAYQAAHETYRHYLGRSFKHQGAGDWNFFKLFIERDLVLVRECGRLSLLVPSGFQTDEGCADLRRWLITGHRLDELTSFENKGWRDVDGRGTESRKQIFPDVHPQFKFGFFKVVKGAHAPKDHAFDARFYLHDPEDVVSPPVRYSVEMIQRFSPVNFGIMEFRSEADYSMCAKIRGRHPLLKELGHQFRREFHITEDARFFRKRGPRKLAAGEVPLYEGKMIHQFDNHFTPAGYCVVEKEVREELLRKEIHRLAQFVRDSGAQVFEGQPIPSSREELMRLLEARFKRRKFKLHYECPRLVYRKIASSTNERTLIATVVGERSCLGESLNYLTPVEYRVDDRGHIDQLPVPAETNHSLACLFNSLALNFYIRSKISANVNLFYLYELPMPSLRSSDRAVLCDSATRLLESPHDVRERAALEVFVARDLYGLSLDDWKHLTGTFTFGSGPTKEELDEIIRRSLALWKT